MNYECNKCQFDGDGNFWTVSGYVFCNECHVKACNYVRKALAEYVGDQVYLDRLNEPFTCKECKKSIDDDDHYGSICGDCTRANPELVSLLENDHEI